MSQEENLVKTSSLPFYWIKEKKTTSVFCILTGILIIAITAVVLLSQRRLVPISTETSNTSHTERQTKICSTPRCVQESIKILSAIDFNVDPCDNFYDFACGNFVNTTQIPEDKNEVDTITENIDEVQLQLKEILSETTILSNEPKAVELARKFYKSCMNETKTEERGVKPFLEQLELFGGWPVLKGDDWNSSWDLVEAIGAMRNNGYPTGYIVSTTVTTLNVAFRRLNVGQPDTAIDRKHLIKGFNDTTVTLYYKLMVDLAVVLGANRTRAENELLDALNFEISLANISVARDLIDSGAFQYNIDSFQRVYPYLSWRKYLKYMLPESLPLDKVEVVWARPPTYLERLSELLNKTSNRTIANYLMWRTVYFASEYLTDELRYKRFKFDASSSLIRRVPRWKECIGHTSNLLALPLGYTYANRHFNELIKDEITDMLDIMRDEVILMLKKADWMDEITKDAAFLKIKTLAYGIGFSDGLNDSKRVDDHFKHLQLNVNDDLLSNVIKMNKFNVDGNFVLLLDKVDFSTKFSPSTVNAFHHGIENKIVIPAGILRGRLYSLDRPRYLNFGGIGQILGHEIMHGFGEYGSNFLFKGNYFRWWQTNTPTKFQEKIKCLIDQYGNFTVPSLNISLNALNTQEEDQADNGGFKLAYNSYKKWTENREPEPVMPFFESRFSRIQLFWISAAQSWCSTVRDSYLKDAIETDKHSPKRYRILGSFANIKDFADDFKCPAGSPMNPTKKCDLW